MPTIGELIINLNANTASFVTQLNSVKNLSFETATQIQRSFSLIGTAAMGMLSVAAGAMAEGIDKTAEWEVHILHLAESAGTTTETMSGLSFAAKMMGLEIDQVAMAMERFDRQLIQAQLGVAMPKQNMFLLGIDPAQIKTSDDALKQLADHFAKMPDGAAKSGEAMMAFSKAGAALIPILNLGSQGVQDFMDQAKAMGLVISKDQAEQAELFEQNITRMQESLHGLMVEITNATLPALNDLTAHFQDTSKQQGLLHAFGELTAAAMAGEGSFLAYVAGGGVVVATQEKMRSKVTDLSAAFAQNKKAQDALQKSYGSLIEKLSLGITTVGMSSTAAEIAKINYDAQKAGIDGLTIAEQNHITALNAKLSIFKQFPPQTAIQKAQADNLAYQVQRLAQLHEEIPLLQRQADLAMQMQFGPSAVTLSPQANAAFTASIDQQTAALEHQIATFGMSADAIARYDLAQLDSSQVAQDQIAKFKQLQDQMDAMKQHAQSSADAWKQFGDVANRSLDDLIFSGKSFTQVLSDITKQLGEMFLKWTLFGFGQSNTKGGGGFFGMLMGLMGMGGGGAGAEGSASVDISSIVFPAFASGGSVAAGQTVMVGENGPELFTPSTSGAIIPNGTSVGGGGVVNYYIDARGSSITEEMFKRSLALSEQRAVQAALSMGREISLRTA